MKYKGSCHCGQIVFEVEGELTQTVECNCSICSKKGALHWAVPTDKLRVLTPEEKISTYTFGQERIKHRFCPTCGVQTFSVGAIRPGNPMAVVNVRCLDGVDITSLPLKHFDGRSL
jgi:hypothetical protein